MRGLMKTVLLSMDHWTARQIAWGAKSLGLTPRGLDIVMFLVLGFCCIILAITTRKAFTLSVWYAIAGVITLSYANLMASVTEKSVEKIYMAHHKTWQSPWRPINITLIPFAFYGFPALRGPIFLWLLFILADYGRALHIAHFIHSRPPSS
jgi:ABC-type transport system involved in multi-copper enzyme maturation permease subunit